MPYIVCIVKAIASLRNLTGKQIGLDIVSSYGT